MKFISTYEQLIDIFTKPFLEYRLVHIRELLDRNNKPDDSVVYTKYFFDILVFTHMGLDLTLELTTYGILPFLNHEQDILLRLDAKDHCALNKMHDKARIIQHMLNKGILNKASSKDHLYDIHLFAFFHMVTGKKISSPKSPVCSFKDESEGKRCEEESYDSLSLVDKDLLGLEEQVKYSPSFKKHRFGRNNISPIRLDTIKLTLPSTYIKPSKKELTVAEVRTISVMEDEDEKDDDNAP
ncbi:hypothetical protein CR513_25075, partial [Mucuna pruriens]